MGRAKGKDSEFVRKLTKTRFLKDTSLFMMPELDPKLQSAEARCKVLEKQLEYMRKMVENAKKERNTFIENQVVQ